MRSGPRARPTSSRASGGGGPPPRGAPGGGRPPRGGGAPRPPNPRRARARPPAGPAASLRWGRDGPPPTADDLSRARRRAPADTVADWRAQSAVLLASPAAHDPELAGRATTLMGVRLPLADHFRVRAFETWVHTDDIGRALDKPVPPPLADHLWQLVRLAVRMLDRAVGASAEPVALTVSGEGRAVEWVLGSQDEPVAAEVVLDPVDFCLLLGGRSDPAQVPRGVAGDEAAADRLLNRASALSWL
ncbi:maleylpyruvate isomerase family mycothiol-dependent enzyme [Streptomyces sp. NPDC059037]|uniref:maleylpyruvate isomerase family mycothiol-dependent enzyme n=1 Tax=Streptomyces sp. NPDC059037 TaxID=3346710 RepID=UPI0036959195